METIRNPDATRNDQLSPGAATPLDCMASNASAFHKAVSRMRTNHAARYGLTLTEFNVIRLLSPDTEWTVTDVANALGAPTSLASRTATGLVDKGLVSRRRPRGDRRTVLLRLTEEGVVLRQSLLREVREYERGVIQDIDPEDLGTCITTFSEIAGSYISQEESLVAVVCGAQSD